MCYKSTTTVFSFFLRIDRLLGSILPCVGREREKVVEWQLFVASSMQHFKGQTPSEAIFALTTFLATPCRNMRARKVCMYAP